ncbi:MAG TPA: hypothetical protein VG733_12450 [Chthoniobacteraceae bacterium]|nr:hypothetical protein [Chthoniobacteraceae bacterium]
MNNQNPTSNKATIRLLGIGMICAGLTANCAADITYPEAPKNGEQTARKYITPKFLQLPDVNNITIARPHQTYGAGLRDLAAGHLLSVAKPFTWRYILVRDGSAVGDVLLNGGAPGAPLTFNSVERSDFANETLVALQKAEQLPQVKKQDYEVRYLEVAGANFVALWLHAKSDDIIIPLGGTNPFHPYSETEIIKLLQPNALRTLQETDNGKGG